ncbi:MAG TPA: sulfotransferase domain-containing protein [Nitrolancea sp.]|nr:sulfotransferase domain-containing protein [Nitrolancea sp.]
MSMNARAFAIRTLPTTAVRHIFRHRRQAVDAMVRLRIRTGRLGPLPSFLVIGFGKCGTTELYDRLVEHPNVLPSLRKEINYFMYRYAEGVDWYRAHFAMPLMNGEKEPYVVGEASPGYAIDPFAPQRVADLIPNVKLIVLLRDPVARAYSHYHHERRLRMEPLDSFEAALAAEPERLRGERERVYSDPTYRRFAWYLDSYVTQGIYADYLPQWLDVFPREQLLAIQSEAFFRDPATTLQTIVRFLELPDWTPPPHQGHKAFVYPPMRPEVKEKLREFYAPHNERLFALLDVDYGWNDWRNLTPKLETSTFVSGSA